jgi:hypothetical protein
MNNSNGVVAYFQRHEQKYLLDQFQYNEILRILPAFVREDEFFRSTVYSIYYDTADFTITRKLSDKSAYKEKLRLRSYGIPRSGDTVYVELKKKLNGVSYKQRFPIPFVNMESCFNLNTGIYANYISGETSWLLRLHKPFPRFMVWYDRLAFRGIENKDLRITFDSPVHWRDSDIDYGKSYGYPLLPENTWLMELKIKEAMPLFLARHLALLKIFPVSFSKHKTVYENIINNRRPLYVWIA